MAFQSVPYIGSLEELRFKVRADLCRSRGEQGPKSTEQTRRRARRKKIPKDERRRSFRREMKRIIGQRWAKMGRVKESDREESKSARSE